MYDWSLCGSTARASSEPAAVLDDARVVPGREPRGAGAPREREQLARTGSSRCSACTGSASRRARSRARTARRSRAGTPRAASSVTCGRPERGGRSRARRSRPPASSTRARHSGACGSIQSRERHADRRSGPARKQRDRAVDAAAHRDGDSRRSASARNDRPDRVRERVHDQPSPGTAAASSSVRPTSEASSPSASASTIRVVVEDESDVRPLAPRVESPATSIIEAQASRAR